MKTTRFFLLVILLMLLTVQVLGQGEPIPNPESVTLVGTLQDEFGCPGEWQPECEESFLTYDAADDLWTATFDLPAGSYEYKAALNGNWEISSGLNADRTEGSANIPLTLEEDASVFFFYDHKTGWVSDNVNSIIANVPGNYQDEIGCPGEWQPDCLRSLLQDPDGDGIYTFMTPFIPAGDYEAKVAYNQSWDVNYGVDGAAGGANILFTVPSGQVLTTFTYNTADNVMTIETGPIPADMVFAEPGNLPRGNLATAKAFWVMGDTIAWNARDAADDTDYVLHSAPNGGIQLTQEGVEGSRAIALTVDPNGLSEEVLEKFPHLEGLTALKIDPRAMPRIDAILRGQVAVSAQGADGALLDATSLQIAGALDDLFTTDETLGVSWEGDIPTIKVWAPTAKNVNFHLFADSNPDTTSTVLEMDRDRETGVWSITGDASWKNQYYLYEVEVFAPATMRVETNMVTDPYSLSLAMNSTRTQIVDLNDPELKPEGWDSVQKPALTAPEDITVYELHVRDFSAFDESVPEEYRGTFMAFTVPESNGMQHLIALAEAGLTHLHLLPVFDLATINENKSEWTNPDLEELASFAPESEEQQAAINAVRDQDAFNWGYDPYHYTAPEGSYSTNPDGPQRILEFRQMVQSLNQNGLRVVVDVVYNHTNSAGQAEKSVLDKIVPGYYHRLDENGAVTTSTCCPNTASEHNMMQKLMVDSLVVWATQYKVDGFRFDLMGHHMLRNMQEVRETLDALTLEEEGVDGKKIYVYGEGWNFGEVENNARGVNATQLNIGGLGIGTFSDRLRDAVRGGSPFGGQQEQGFINGLYVNPNEVTPGSEDEQLERVLLFADQIRVGLAGNLADYSFEGREGEMITGADVPYGSSPAGYTLDPQEHIVYIDKHDNETLFDIIQYKAPVETSLEDRVRMQNLGLSIIGYSQGIPFFHAGTDMLRSKSLDRNSYNSGDWFNRLDFTYETNNWGVGLPMSSDNQSMWPVMQELLANPDLKPTQENILANVEYFREILQIRYSSPLFRLRNAERVQEMVSFLNTGVEQTPGLIVMQLTDTRNLDSNYAAIVVVFNANFDEITFADDSLAGMNFMLHPVQAESSDEVVRTASLADGTFTVPGLTAAVFVVPDGE